MLSHDFHVAPTTQVELPQVILSRTRGRSSRIAGWEPSTPDLVLMHVKSVLDQRSPVMGGDGIEIFTKKRSSSSKKVGNLSDNLSYQGLHIDVIELIKRLLEFKTVVCESRDPFRRTLTGKFRTSSPSAPGSGTGTPSIPSHPAGRRE
ncbi:hypothetical protein TNCV_727911 [Trichonephila clavipes]|nr:hypothetical protein TNCV_727911 [Trichonephila clavipes]